MRIIATIWFCCIAFSGLCQDPIYSNAYDLYYAHEFAAARDLFTLSLLKEPGSKCKSYRFRGTARLFLNDIEGARNDVDSSILLCPGDAANYYNKGFYFTYLKANDSALFYYDLAIKIQPSNADYYTNRAIVHGLLGDTILAINDLRKATSIDSANYLAHFNLGVIYKNIGEYGKALPELQKAYRLDTANISAVIYLAYCYLKTGNSYQAFLLCNEHLKDVELKSDLEDMYIIRGEALYALGNKAEACRDFKDLYSIDQLKGKTYIETYCK